MSGTKLRRIAAAVGGTAYPLAAAPASAAVTCDYNDAANTLTVSSDADACEV